MEPELSDSLEKFEPWHGLTRWTSARIAMGRAGASLRTTSMLEFNSDHALARDAVYTSLDTASLQKDLEREGFETILTQSRARDRAEYLRRPDLGRSLNQNYVSSLKADADFADSRLTVVVSDGLSALAPERHALPLLRLLRAYLTEWQIDKVVLATQARVALGDEIGELRQAKAVLVLIGERPGLKSADSLGAYLTYRPRVGRTDAERNCISNIRPEGLSYEQAAFRLFHLLSQARVLGATGVTLKDDSDAVHGLWSGELQNMSRILEASDSLPHSLCEY
jgi:ethanolamine ammonia-lyase small subunit